MSARSVAMSITSPAANFPQALSVEGDLTLALRGVLDVLIAVPSHAFRNVLREIAPHLAPEVRVAWATKGFEVDSGLLPHQVAREVLGAKRAVAVLSGPTFAREVGAGLPTAMTVASPDAAFATALAQGVASSNFRAYTSTDIVGVEVGGAVKNVLAVGAGLVGWARLRCQHADRADHTRPGRDDASRGRRWARGAKRSWDSPVSAISCSPAPTINPATVDSACCWRRDARPRLRSREIGQAVEGYVAAKAVRAVAQRETGGHAALRGHLQRALRTTPCAGSRAGPDEPAHQGRDRVISRFPLKFAG